MQNTANIKKELDQTEGRITELENDLTEQTTAFEAVQQGFVAGKSSLNEFHAEQSKLTLVSQAVESLKATYQKLKSDFKNTNETETRQKTLETMKAISDEANSAFSNYVKYRTELAETCRTVGEKMVDALLLSRRDEREFEALFNKLVPGVENYRAVTVEQRESFDRAKDELKEIGLSDEDFNGMRNSHRPMPTNKFSNPLFDIQHIIASNDYVRTSEDEKTDV